MNELIVQLIHTSGARLYGLILGIASLSLTARWLGPDGRGVAASAATWITALATLGHFSLGQIAVKNSSSDKTNQWLIDAFPILLTSISISLVLILSIFGVSKYFGINFFYPLSNEFIILILISFPFYILDIYASNLLTSLGYLEKYNKLLVLSRTIAFLLLPLLILTLGLGPIGMLLSNLIAQALICLGSLRYLLKNIERVFLPHKSKFFSFFSQGAVLHINTIGTFLFSGGDILLLNYLRGPRETGYYQLSSQLISVMLIIPQSASLIFYGQVSKMGPKMAWEKQKKLILVLTFLMAFIAILASMTVNLWLPIIASSSFQDSILIFRWQLITMVAMSFCTMMSAQWISRGYFWQVSLLAIIVGSLNFLANRIFIPPHGMIGAAWAGLAAFIFAAIINTAFYVFISRKES